MSGNIELREAQYLKAMDEKFCRKIARQLVLGKIYNSLEFLVRQRESGKIQTQLEKILSIAEYVEKNPELSKEKLFGYERNVARLYFTAFSELIKNQDFPFSRRIKHPPPDPVNIILSLGYTLLFNSVHAMVNMVGLDSYRGFMHEWQVRPPNHGLGPDGGIPLPGNRFYGASDAEYSKAFFRRFSKAER